MRQYVSYNLDDLGTLTAPDHARDYLENVSGSKISRDWNEFIKEFDDYPKELEELGAPNSVESYIIPFERGSKGPDTMVEVVEIFDFGNQIYISGEGRYLENTRSILDSENPKRESSSQVMRHGLIESWEKIKNSLG